ncbi:hypothetical protein GALL_206700 [mine drainage metagenome]|uniref:Urease accessory protein UreH-like transmembrane domain-containing protein n=1 Tax=mine drainage metagenome TaxID=410659 RepID=A0A1J5RMJ9_9ZZZZ
MPDTGFIAVFLIGLLGGTHCLAMCGGIVGALTMSSPGQRPPWNIRLAYNAGRIISYAAIGAVIGGIGSFGLLLNHLLPVQMALYIAANLMLLALGLYLCGVTRALAFTERIGQRLWARIQPLTRRYLPARRVAQALPLGLLWGFLPCGMVYSIATLALLSGSAFRGAALMLAFGLGTLPNLLAANFLLAGFSRALRGRSLRLAAGAMVLAFGILGLFKATTLGGRLWAGLVCHV